MSNGTMRERKRYTSKALQQGGGMRVVSEKGATDMTEPCEICELWMRGVECENESCPVAVMKRENAELKAKVSRLESDNGYAFESNLGRIYEMGEA